MTDREMLKLAARAAGYYFHGMRVGLDYENCYVSTTNNIDDWFIWAPHADDGDALRLKVSLHLIVGSYSTYSSVGGTYTTGNYTVPDEITVWHHETAWRRVRGGAPCNHPCCCGDRAADKGDEQWLTSTNWNAWLRRAIKAEEGM